MHSKVYTATTLGIQSHEVEVEVDLSLGLLRFCIVGLPDKAIKESKERIRAAFKNSGLRLPERLITVNLAPAHLKKQDVLFDIPIAVAILQAARLIEKDATWLEQTLFLGELSLDGAIRSVCGVLSIVHDAVARGRKRIIVPLENVPEAQLIKGIEIIGVSTLVQLVNYLRDEVEIEPAKCLFGTFQNTIQQHPLDFSHVKGQWQAKRALQIAAAGHHNILFIGPPGSGKTMLAKRVASILPPMTFSQVIQTSKIYSIAGLLGDTPLIVHRPFRSPHHTISQAGLVGGGSIPRPGEISLAHNGVLFLDELTEFKRTTLEVLRQPLESGNVLISRAQTALQFPSSFLLVAALNPCPCGYFGDATNECSCTRRQVDAYLAKLSGPLLDRIDLHVGIKAVAYDDLHDERLKSQSSRQMREKVLRAVAVQITRLQGRMNASMNSQEVEKYCLLSSDAQHMLKKAFDILKMSMRGYHKVLKIARTIADIDQSVQIELPHIQEAITYRSLDQQNKL